MLRLLIPSYPLPSPALMAFRLYLALLEFLLECIVTLATTLFTSHHQNIAVGAVGSGTARWELSPYCLPSHPRPQIPVAAGSRGQAAVGSGGQGTMVVTVTAPLL